MRWGLAAVVMFSAQVSWAEPTVGMNVGVGDSVGGEADGKVGTGLYVYGRLGGGFTLGGELSGALEGYTGGYGCGTQPSMGTVPAVAVSCVQPSIASHALFGTGAAPSSWSRLRLELGLGATAVYLLPGSGGHTERDLFASGLIRAMYLGRLGRAFTGQWWAGLAFEERVIGIGDPHLVRSLGLVLEARP